MIDRQATKELEVFQSFAGGYLFDVDAASHYDPVPLDAIEKKFDHIYESSAPIELLAYFDVLGAPPQSQLRPL